MLEIGPGRRGRLVPRTALKVPQRSVYAVVVGINLEAMRGILWFASRIDPDSLLRPGLEMAPGLARAEGADSGSAR